MCTESGLPDAKLIYGLRKACQLWLRDERQFTVQTGLPRCRWVNRSINSIASSTWEKRKHVRTGIGYKVLGNKLSPRGRRDDMPPNQQFDSQQIYVCL